MLTIISLKLVCIELAKVMVNWETTKRIIPSIYHAGEQLVLNTVQNVPTNSNFGRWVTGATNRGQQQSTEAQNSTEYLVHNWLEALFASFQMVVLWHEPFISICAISGLLTSFLLLTYFAPRFYATIMIVIFVYTLTKVWFRHIWPEIRVPPEASHEEESRLDVDRWTYLHPQLMTLAELKQLTSNLIKTSEFYLQKLLALRREKPVKFCLTICSTLSCTAYIGNRIDGFDLIFWIMTALLTAPGIYLHLLPDAFKEYLRHNIIIYDQFFHGVNQRTNESNQDPEQESSSIAEATSAMSPTLSLFEHLKHLAGQELTSGIRSSTPSNSSSITTAPLLLPSGEPTIQASNQDATTTMIATKGKRFETMTQVKEEEEEDSQSRNDSGPRKSSDDLSSNESTSMIDFDEDQQDGFVIL